MSSKVIKAYKFAAEAHKGQVRKYTGEPYINHPYEVMDIVASIPHTEDMLCAALLHDVLEDTDTTEQEITKEFGESVCEMVKWLTDVSKPEDGNRAIRKEIDRMHIAKAPPEVKTIKLADVLSNTSSILEHDEDFAKVYLKEKALLLDVLQEGDPTLYEAAKDIVERHSMTDTKALKMALTESDRVAKVAAGRWEGVVVDTEALANQLLKMYRKQQEAFILIAPPQKR